MHIRTLSVGLALFALTVLAQATPAFAAEPGRRICGSTTLQQLVPYEVQPWHGPMNLRREAPKVGDTRAFWTYDLSVMPPENVTVQSTCRAVTDDVAIWVADDQWKSTVQASDINTLLAALADSTPRFADSGLVANDVDLFGEPPTFSDGDPRLTVLVYPIPGYKGYLFDGFFRREDLAPFVPGCENNPMTYCSNELAMIHVNSEDVASEYMQGVIAHEFEHLIHYGHSSNEEIWLDESLAELAMVYSGYTDPGNLEYYAQHPDSSLIVEAPVDYGACLLFGAYLFERLGREGIRTLIEDAATGVQSIQNYLATTLTFGQFFGQWSAAILAGNPDLDEGQFGFTLMAPPEMSGTQISSAPKEETVTVNASAMRFFYASLNAPGAGWVLNVTCTDVDSDATCWYVGEEGGEVRQILTGQTLTITPMGDTVTFSVAMANASQTPRELTLAVEWRVEQTEEPAVEAVEAVEDEVDIQDEPDAFVEETISEDLVTNDAEDFDDVTPTEKKDGGSDGCSASPFTPATHSIPWILLLALLAMAALRPARD